MKKYLAVFVAPIEAYDKMKEEMKGKSPDERKAEMDAWMKWMDEHKADIVDNGAPVGSAKRIAADGTVTDTRNEIGGYMIVQAESAEEAAALFKNSPHFGVEGGGIEVMEMMQMP
jgi:hypothetical protein